MRKLGAGLVAVAFLAGTGCYATIRGPGGRPESRQGQERQHDHERDRGHDRDRDRGDEHARGDQGERNHD